MNLSDEGQILGAEELRLRALDYNELQEFLSPWTLVIEGPSGTRYQLEIEAVWDDRKSGNLRVIVSTDDGKGWPLRTPRAFSRSFIKAPDGGFIGE